MRPRICPDRCRERPGAGPVAASESSPVGEEEGFTRSHQLHVDRPRLRRDANLGGGELARRLERQRLLIDLVGRIGTAEVSRLGLVPTDMSRLADLLIRGGLRGDRVAREVLAWRRTFRKLRFA